MKTLFATFLAWQAAKTGPSVLDIATEEYLNSVKNAFGGSMKLNTVSLTVRASRGKKTKVLGISTVRQL